MNGFGVGMCIPPEFSECRLAVISATAASKPFGLSGGDV